MIALFLVSLGVAAMAPLVTADGIYVACVTSVSGEAKEVSTQVSLNECLCAHLTEQSICNQGDFAGLNYAYWIPDESTGSGVCQCTSTEPTFASMVATTGTLSTCPGSISAYRITNAFTFDNCYASTGPFEDGRVFIDRVTLDTCLRFCWDSGKKEVLASNMLGTWKCYCMDHTYPSGVECRRGWNRKYVRTDVPAASAVVRRNSRLFRAANGPEQLCPYSMTACATAPGSHEYECLDTTNELESCGGCRYGVVGRNGTASAASGTDCTALPGVILGGVRCEEGECKVSACDDGYSLIDGLCI